jgi:hypothetical protein
MRNLLSRLAFTLALALGVGSQAGAVPVDLELVIAIDISGSVDTSEFSLQRDGWAAALEDPSVVAAIQNGQIGSIAVAVVYWQGQPQTIDFTTNPDPLIAALGVQVVPTIQQVVPWTLISDQTSASAASSLLRAASAQFAYDFQLGGGGTLTITLGNTNSGSGPTGVANALDFSVSLLSTPNGFEGTRSVLDVSGDGYENVDHDPAGCSDPACVPVGNVVTPDPSVVITNPAVYFAATGAARDAAVAAGITVNGLPILTDISNLDSFFYAPFVTGGPGAFVRVASGFSDIQQAATDKLVAEVPEPALLTLLGAAAAAIVGRRRFAVRRG